MSRLSHRDDDTSSHALPEYQFKGMPVQMKQRGSVGVSGSAAAAGKILQLVTAAFVGFSLPLCLSVSDVGVFFFAQSVVVIGAIVAQLGFPHTIPFLVGRSLAEGDSGRARVVVAMALKMCLAGGLVAGGLVAVSAYVIPMTAAPIAVEIRPLVAVLVPMILLTALLALMAEVQRTVYALGPASFLPLVQNAVVSLYLVLALILSWRPTVAMLLAIALSGLAAACVWGALRTRRVVATWSVASASPVSDVLSQAWPNFVSAVSFAAAAQADIWVVGLNGNPADVGHYGLAVRIAGLIAIPLTVVSLTILPHIITSWTLGRRRYLQWLLRLSATGSISAAFLGFVVFAVFGSQAISLVFGSSYQPAFMPALILSAGQVVFSAAGVSGYVLITLGRQKLAMAVILTIGIATVLIAMPVMRLYGITGVACVYACSAAVQAAVNAYFVRRCFGLRSGVSLINPLRARKLLTHKPPRPRDVNSTA